MIIMTRPPQDSIRNIDLLVYENEEGRRHLSQPMENTASSQKRANKKKIRAPFACP